MFSGTGLGSSDAPLDHCKDPLLESINTSVLDEGEQTSDGSKQQQHSEQQGSIIMKTEDKEMSKSVKLPASSYLNQSLDERASVPLLEEQEIGLNQNSQTETQAKTLVMADKCKPELCLKESSPMPIKGNEDISVETVPTFCDGYESESSKAFLVTADKVEADENPIGNGVFPLESLKVLDGCEFAVQNKPDSNIKVNIKSIFDNTPNGSQTGTIKKRLQRGPNPSIVLCEMDSPNTPVQVNKDEKTLPVSLHLSLEPHSGVPSLSRKSPVTVQEWVDSIPPASQLEEPEEEPIASEAAESEEHGENCPSVTVRPASGQEVAVADKRREAFSRDASPSLQSDTGSHASSVDSYLDARRPDPEEVLMGLGFGGPLHAAEAEVSRIPARFLQPSKVKGVAIDDFLRYQQDLIETFESGYSGYRGLTGGSQIPSVIVAKIMEKLREHERESSTKSSAGSSPGHGHGDLTRRRFSRAAQRITVLSKMKSRDSLGSGGQPQSVLNPDNRKFLDNQGSKSPEVPRKRMIIGHRSFTFDGEGQLIETDICEETTVQEIVTPVRPPPPRPLVHKDSVLSSATSLSLTSYDSDSDTDEASGEGRSNEGLRNTARHQVLQRLHSTPVSGENIQRESMLHSNGKDEELAFGGEGRRKSLPLAVDQILSDLSPIKKLDVTALTSTKKGDEKADDEVGSRIKDLVAQREKNWQDLLRVKSASSTGRSDMSLPVVNAVLGGKLSATQTGLSKNVSTVKVESQFQTLLADNKGTTLKEDGHSSKTTPERLVQSGNQVETYCISDFPTSGSSSLPMNSPDSSCSFNSDRQYHHYLQRMYSLPKASAMFLDKDTRRKLSLHNSEDSHDVSPPDGAPNHIHWSNSSVSSWESEAVQSPVSPVSPISPASGRGEDHSSTEWGTVEVNPTISVEGPESKPRPSSTSPATMRRGSLKRQQKIEDDDCYLASVDGTSQLNLSVASPIHVADKGDSFEMEELGVEEEGIVTRTGSANSANSGYSDSSGFQEEQSQHVLHAVKKCTLNKQLSESEPLLCSQTFLHSEDSYDEPVQAAEHLKRLSLPVIRVLDELGHNQLRSSSFHRETHPYMTPLRRAKSMPCQLAKLGLQRLSDTFSPGSAADSIGNMFSSCSDESVIHVPRMSVDVTSGHDEGSLCPLAVALSDSAGEPEALREGEAQQCCECNTALNQSLCHCRGDLGLAQLSNHSISCVRRDLLLLQKSQNHIRCVMERVQYHVCNTPKRQLNAVFEKVAEVVQQQSKLCTQLETVTAELEAMAVPVSQRIDSSCDYSHACQQPADVIEKSEIPTPCQPQHASEACQLLCHAVQEENRRLQDLVRNNIDELTQIRQLLQIVLPQ